MIDSVRFQYALPEMKRQIILDRIDKCVELARAETDIPAREVAGVVGKISASRRAFGQVLGVATRHTQNILGKAVLHERDLDDPNWEVDVQLDISAMEELTLCRNIIASKNGYGIPTQT